MMEVNNTTSRQEHWWFIMRQRASGKVNPEMKKQANIYIYMFSQIFCFLLLLYKCQKRISWPCPSRFRFWTSPWYLMVVLLPSWGKNKCRALLIFSCGQAALWMVFSVCLSVCPSVCLSVRHTFLTMFPSSYHHEIFRSYHHGPG